LRYYAFVFSSEKIQSIRLNPRGQRLNPISAEGHFLACSKFYSLILSFEERVAFVVALAL
jgi:hypothetical protein